MTSNFPQGRSPSVRAWVTRYDARRSGAVEGGTGMAGSTAPEPGGVFISYRRQETAAYAGRLADLLTDRLGRHRVFIDVDDIEGGLPFEQAIDQALGSCQVLLALIGAQWLDVTDENGRRRLDDPNDRLRREIEAALEGNVRVIPVLVGGARMPQAQDLPNSLAELHGRQSLTLRHESFPDDARRLVATIKRILQPPPPKLPPKAEFYRAFWTRFLERIRAEHPKWTTARIPQTDNWITMPSAIKGAVYRCSFAAGGTLRAELDIDSGDAEANLELFRALKARAATIEGTYGKPLSWEEVPGRQAFRIADYTDGDVTNTDQHDAYIDWFFETGTRLRKALALPPKPKLVEHPEAVHTLDHVFEVHAVAFSPDGELLATASRYGMVRLWDWAIEKEQRPITVDDDHNPVHRLAFSPDGRLLATAGEDGTAQVWELATRQQQTGFEAASGKPVADVAFSPDGRLLATAGWDGTARVWELATGQQQRNFSTELADPEPMASVAFSPDGRLVATGSFDNRVRVWELATEQEQEQLRIIHAYAVWRVAFSPDGRLLATGSVDGTARVTEVATGQEQRSFEHKTTLSGLDVEVSSTVRDVAFSPDGRLLATASRDGAARVWELATGQKRAMVKDNDYNRAVVSVAFSPNGRRLATASLDRTAKVWALVP